MVRFPGSPVTCVLAVLMLETLLGFRSWGADGDFYAAEAEAIAAAVDRVGPAVVQIELVGVAEVEAGEVAADAPSAGTVISPEGLILASSMVTARPAASILVVLPDGSRLPAEVVAKDTGRELVLLRVAPQAPLAAVDLTPAADVRVGQYAIAVGRIRAEGAPARSVGIVSAVGRLQGRALQTDARVSPPFYGGPLVNIRGEILGIVVPAMPEAGEGGDKAGWYDAGIGFVAPVDQIAARLEKLKQGESIRPGQLGIVAGSSDPSADGTTIAAVRVGSPAAEVGIEPGDELVAIDGVKVRRHADIRQLLGPRDAGTPVSLVLRRDGQELTVEPTLVAEIPPFNPQLLGILAEDGEDIRITAVFPGSPADRGGLKPDDLLRSLGGQSIESVEQLRRQVMTLAPEQAVEVQVTRGEEALTIEVVPQSIAGTLVEQLPPLPGEPIKGEWTITELTLPDVPNKGAMVAPAAAPEGTPLGLLIVFAEPGASDVKEVCQTWMLVAREHRVVVGVLGAADASQWKPEEAELGARLAALIRQRHPSIQSAATGATGDDAGAAIAMIAAWAEAAPFGGVAVDAKIRPPGIRIAENDPASPTQLLIRAGEDRPNWADALQRVGYAVVTAGEEPAAVARWIWTLVRI